jgi:CHASE2 domain-containing sensor protein
MENMRFHEWWNALYKRRWRIALYLALVAIAFLLERTGDEAENVVPRFSQTARNAYLRTSTFGFRKPDARFTALVLLDDKATSHSDPPEVALQACKRRLYLAKLIDALEVQAASVIVLDFMFNAQCPIEDKMLAASMSRTAERIPLIVGQNSEVVRTIQAREPTRVGKGIDEADLVPVTPNISAEVRGVTYGLIMLIADNRHIPLRWQTASSRPGTGGLTEHGTQDSLVLAAAIAQNRSVADSPTLSQYMRNSETPLTRFIPPSKFPHQNGLDLLCRDQDLSHWEDCKPKPDRMSIFRGHVAVLGFGDNDAGTDMHESVLGVIPGVFLQANYIECLLDGSYLTQPWWPIELALSFVCFAVIEVVFEFISNMWLALPVALLTIGCFYVISFIAVVEFGYYLQLWIPTFVAFILKLVTTLQGRTREGLGAVKQ